MKTCLILDAAFEGGRMFAGATSTAYLLISGLTMSDVAVLKIFHSGLIMLAEVPTGIVADIQGSRKSLIFSALLGALGFSLYYIGNNFWIFLAAEACIALCLCFWSGAYEAYAIDTSGISDNEVEMNRFFHLNSSLNSFSIVICGFLGGVIANQNMAYVFLPCITVMLLLCYYLHLAQKKTNKDCLPFTRQQHWVKILKQQIEATFKQGIFNLKIANYIVALVIMQSLIIPLIYYWQPWFTNLSKGNYGISLGLVFVAFNTVIFITSIIVAKLANNPFYRSSLFTSCNCLGFGISLFMMVSVQRFDLALILFCLLEGFYKIGFSSLYASLNQKISSQNRASVLSSVSLVSRIGSLTSLGLIGIFFKMATSEAEGLKITFTTCAFLAVIFSTLALITIMLNRKDAISKSS